MLANHDKAPTKTPTEAPTKTPTKVPTKVPTEAPTEAPTKTQTEAPTKTPTKTQTEAPTKTPSRCGGGVISVPPQIVEYPACPPGEDVLADIGNKGDHRGSLLCIHHSMIYANCIAIGIAVTA